MTWNAVIIRGLAAAALGVLAALSQEPYGHAWLLAISLPGVYALWRSAQGAGAFWIGWAFGAAYFGLSLSWISHAFMVDPDKFAAFRLPAAAVMCGGLALFWGAGLWGAALLKRGGAPLAFAAGLMLAEIARAHVFTGFPWGLFGYALLDTPLSGLFSAVGVMGATFLIVLFGACVGHAVIHRNMISLAGAFGVVLIAGALLLGQTPLPAQDTFLRVGLAQPNVSQTDKARDWAGARAVLQERLLAQTQRLAESGAKVIIWPEAALFFTDQTKYDTFLQDLRGVLRGRAQVISGFIRAEQTDHGWAYFNSVVLFDGDAQIVSIYDKTHLVPFGEYLPFPDLFKVIGFSALADNFGGGYAQGSGPRVLEAADLPPALPMICYEDVFPDEIRDALTNQSWMFHITDDSWFGPKGGPAQHLAISRGRAIELNRSVARVSAAGTSASITPQGEIIAQIDVGKQGAVITDVALSNTRTLYKTLGDWPVFGALFLMLSGLALRRVCNRLSHTKFGGRNGQ